MVAIIFSPDFSVRRSSGYHWYSAPVVDFQTYASDPALAAKRTLRHFAEFSETVSRDSREHWEDSARKGIAMGSAIEAGCRAFYEEWFRQSASGFGQFAEMFRQPRALSLLVTHDPLDEHVVHVAFQNRSLTKRARQESQQGK